jgi:transposase
VNAAEVPVLRKKLRRKEMVTFFEKLAPTVIGSSVATDLPAARP